MKLLQRFKRSSRFPAREGAAFVNSLLSEAGKPQVTETEVQCWVTEIKADRDMAAAYEAAIPFLASIAPHKRGRYEISWPERVDDTGVFRDIYCIVRAFRPSIVVETGVAAGTTSSFILAALKHNGSGHLFSIDLPAQAEMSHLPFNDSTTGVLVPEAMKNLWTLVKADTTYALAPLLRDRPPQMFVHDSHHSYDHMMFEYALAHKHLPKGGLLISDDVLANDAAKDFSRAKGLRFIANSANTNVAASVIY
jgi:predicted O-methyltransferase YrrM